MGYVGPSAITRGPFGELNPLAAALVMGLGLSLTPTTYAANFAVTNLNDSGAGSLRDAIGQANTASGADTISFSVSGTITLASQIVISDDLTINGPGSGSLTVSSGAGTNRIFYVNDNNPNVTISGLTLTRTSGQTSNFGGAIYNYGGTLTIQNSVLTGNKASGNGGAVYSRYGTVNINNSTLSSNTAQGNGGAIDMYYGTVNITNGSILSGNQSTEGRGGAVFLYAGTVTVANSTLSGNSADEGGGAIYVHGYYYDGKGQDAAAKAARAKGRAHAAVKHPTKHAQNFAAHAQARATRAHVGGAHATIKARAKAKVQAKRALAKAKGHANPSYFNYASVNISDSTFSGNQAGIGDGGAGGALYAKAASIGIQRSTFSGNSANDSGGALYQRLGAMTVDSSTFSTNTAPFGSAISRAGGDYYEFNSTTITNSTFSGNVATTESSRRGGAVFFYNQVVTIQNSTFTGNTAAGSVGGAITLYGAFLNLHSTILANSTDSSGTRDIFLSGSEEANGGIAADHSLIVNGGGFIPFDATNVLGQNPLLGPLANNGGPTQTHALLSGSPAIDKGSNPAALAFDQRGNGFPRTTGPQTDIGAFEGIAAGPPPPVTLQQIPTLSNWGTAMLSALLGGWALLTGFGRRRKSDDS